MKLAALAVLALASPVFAQGLVKLTPVPTEAMKKIGYYAPQRLSLSSDKPASLKKAPEGLRAPLYGVLPIGGAGGKNSPVYHVILDEPEGAEARLYIDSNGNGDLTDDAPAEWKGRISKVKPKAGEEGPEHEYTMYNGGGTVKLAAGHETLDAHIAAYRFDKNDPGHAATKDKILYYRDYAYEGEVTLGGKKYKAMLADENASGDFRGKALPPPAASEGEKDKEKESSSGVALLLDVNGNGKFDSRGERFDIRKPFTIGGTTYEVASMLPLGSQFRINKSSRKAEEIAPTPDHAAGKKITPFNAVDTEGKPVRFPDDFKGRIVMLDFWATWCGPCMGEVPGLVKVYEKYHGEGFEILGISLDTEKTAPEMPKVTTEKGMTWRQVCDRKGWKAEIAQLYAVSGIPQAFLVDGDTGLILPGGLRGDALEGTIKAALAKKKPAQ